MPVHYQTGKIESRIHSAEIKLNTIIDTVSALRLSDVTMPYYYEVFAPDWLAMNIKQLANTNGKL